MYAIPIQGLLTCFTLPIAGLLTNAQEQPALEDAFKGILLMGTALNRAQIYEEDTRGMALVKAQFNAITPENILKGGSVHPSLGI